MVIRGRKRGGEGEEVGLFSLVRFACLGKKKLRCKIGFDITKEGLCVCPVFRSKRRGKKFYLL